MMPFMSGLAPIGLAAIALAAATACFLLVPRVVAAASNRVALPAARPSVAPAARRLHETLRVADLHDDLLLWDRDPLRRSRAGHTDLPRLQQGNVAVQVFSTVTRVPWRPDYERNAAGSDSIGVLAAASRWPRSTWRSPLARALHQAAKLRRAEAASRGRLRVVTSRAELSAALDERARQASGPRLVAAILSTEGLQALEGAAEHVDTLFRHGFRSAGLVHFSDNEVAGSAHGAARGGLTALGREVIARMEELRMLVDVAHASPRAIDDALEIATRPVLVSHGGVQAICPGPRNLDDARLRRIADRGGLFGIGFWREAIGEVSVRGVARSVRHAVSVAGVAHVALGSDWDGAVRVAIGADRLPELTQALLDEGLREEEIRAVMGENAIRFLLDHLP